MVVKYIYIYILKYIYIYISGIYIYEYIPDAKFLFENQFINIFRENEIKSILLAIPNLVFGKKIDNFLRGITTS